MTVEHHSIVHQTFDQKTVSDQTFRFVLSIEVVAGFEQMGR
jgi:hypothetical protein